MNNIDYNDLCEKFQTTLSLSDEPIKLITLPGTPKNQLKGSNLWWNDTSEK